MSWKIYFLLTENWWKPLAVCDAKHLMYSSVLISEMPSSEPLRRSLFCPSWGVGCLPAPALRILRCYLQYLKSSHFNIQVFVYQGKRSSDFPQSAPLNVCQGLLMSPPQASLWEYASCSFLLRWRTDTGVCCQTRGLGCAQGWGTWFHDISGGKNHLPVGWVLKRTSTVWHANHDAACLAPLNANLPGDSSQESSLFTNAIPNILGQKRRGGKVADWFYRNTLSGR